MALGHFVKKGLFVSAFLANVSLGKSFFTRRSMASMSFTSTLITPQQLKTALDANPSKTRVLDASWHMNKSRNATAEFLDARIPSSVFFDIDAIADTSSSLPHMLPTPEFFANAAAEMGICKDTSVVVYTTENCFSAARCWWEFKCFGHDKVHVLNGGLPAWKAAGLPTDTGPFTAPPANEGEPLTAELNPDMVWSANQVLEVVSAGSGGGVAVVDARGGGRFRGVEPEPRPRMRGGHMPGALNVPFASILADGDWTTFKSPDDIRQAFEAAGVDVASLLQGEGNAKVVTSCGSGVTASTLTLGLHLLGVDLTRAPVYDGSWSEWGSEDRQELPVVAEDKK